MPSGSAYVRCTYAVSSLAQLTLTQLPEGALLKADLGGLPMIYSQHWPAAATGYALDQKVELVVSRGRIVIQPSEQVTYSLDALLADITEANAHGELSFGKPVGKEAF